jgi:crotonobetainyl-CoA:carnitine CoA-transferase CaiB-like acyl-CoA transferase
MTVSRPLAGFKVLETGSSIAIAMCAKYFAELGADVFIRYPDGSGGERPAEWPAHLATYLDHAKAQVEGGLQGVTDDVDIY